jgi:hypothetical protein
VKYMRLFAIMVFALMAISVAAQNCSLATVKGNFGSHAEGTTLAPYPEAPPPPYPVAAVGLHNFDGLGNWTITYSISLGGGIVPWGTTVTGTYDVTPDCKLAVTGTSMPVKFVGTIIGEGMTQTIYITYTSAAQIQSGVLTRTPVSGCSNKTFKGKYALAGQGFVYLANPPLAVSHIGVLTANGNGTFFGDATFKLFNVTGTNAFTATYMVNRDCTVSAEIKNSDGSTTHEFGVITGQGNSQEIHLIITDPGWVLSDMMITK